MGISSLLKKSVSARRIDLKLSIMEKGKPKPDILQTN